MCITHCKRNKNLFERGYVHRSFTSDDALATCTSQRTLTPQEYGKGFWFDSFSVLVHTSGHTNSSSKMFILGRTLLDVWVDGKDTIKKEFPWFIQNWYPDFLALLLFNAYGRRLRQFFVHIEYLMNEFFQVDLAIFSADACSLCRKGIDSFTNSVQTLPRQLVSSETKSFLGIFHLGWLYQCSRSWWPFLILTSSYLTNLHSATLSISNWN